MNNPVAIRPAMPAVDGTASRHAATLAEIQKMTSDYHSMQTQLTESLREIDRLNNKIEVTESALVEARQDSKLYQRKLIRLAASMEMIGKLSSQAEAIMKDARDLDEIETDRIVKGEG